jgi:hypothetical protein
MAFLSSSPFSRAADPPARSSPASSAPAKSSGLAQDTPYGPGPSADSVASRETTKPGQAFVGDLRGASALGLGDGITDHTAKWMQVRRRGKEDLNGLDTETKRNATL